MPLSRMELEVKGAGSPEGLVTRILKLEPNLPIPVPIEDLCKQFDITDIRPMDTEGFEGGLITDAERSEGVTPSQHREPLLPAALHHRARLGHFCFQRTCLTCRGDFCVRAKT